MRCRSLLCPAVRCGAVPCCVVLSLSYMSGINLGHVRTYTESQKKSTPSSAQRSSVEQRSAAASGFYRALPCGAVLCRAVPCCAFSFVHIKRSMYLNACGFRVVFQKHGTLGICSLLFAPEMLDRLITSVIPFDSSL